VSALPAPTQKALAGFLDVHAPFTPAPLSPEISVFYAQSLVAVWEAAEVLAGGILPAPFWAYPWAAGIVIARYILDNPDLVRGQRVLDLGAGGGVASLAAAHAGAARVVANDLDEWALTTTQVAAARQHLRVETTAHDFTRDVSAVHEFDVVLCGDLLYEQAEAPLQRALLDEAASNGALVIAGDAGRTYFTPAGMTLVKRVELPVPRDLEGVDVRDVKVYTLASTDRLR
jgi:predicted nicotinamide N-methyase